ncbi:metal ABC transporter permease [Geomesophilobacter sediminis]|uniref:Metal ABC transporter permease n=1 Tax=Geomesophilobacter sediminis TaxID=2798584 RepID=A0A8J7IXP3_9BACT|nr:metal ABC transporter permease [Geomesophilobacter sediminis]MBJ6724727.1 metal ABC transporter permease [Geomesophilobacter sediminis]
MNITDMLSYGFMQRALLGGSLIAILCSVLGVFLVLRRLSLIGDGLAHVTFGSVAIALLFRLQSVYNTLAIIPIVMGCSMGILKLAQRARIFGDAAIGIVSALGIATGVMLASVAGGFNVDLFSYLFGNILSISTSELGIAAALFVVVIAGVATFYNDLFASTFDEELAKSSGIDTDRINTVLVLMTALTVVLAMKVVGIMLISALLILPAATALQLARGFKTAIVSAAAFGVITVITGITVSFVLNLPTGATIVITNFALFACAFGARTLLRRG